MGFSIALIIIVLIVLYSLARTAGESDRTMEVPLMDSGYHLRMQSQNILQAYYCGVGA